MNATIELPNIPLPTLRRCAEDLQRVLSVLSNTSDPDAKLFFAQENSRMQRLIEAAQPTPSPEAK